MEQLNKSGEFAHLFDIRVKKYDVSQGTYITKRVEVFANTRAQAASVCKKLGFEVLDVNMVG